MQLLAVLLTVAFCLSLVSPLCDRNLLVDHTYLLMGSNLKWPCYTTKHVYSQTGKFIGRNVIPTRTQIWMDEAFIVMPRYKPGVPATLGKITLRWKSSLPEISPFPSWSQQEEGNCDALQSAVDLYLDAQDVLWVLDVGVVNTLEHPIRRCPPKVIAYDVKTGRVVRTIDLSNLVMAESRLQYLVVDYNEDGDAFVYVSDAATRAILVHDVTHSAGWRVVLPQAVTLGCPQRAVLYIALIHKSSDNTFLYFTYLSSPKLFALKTEFLQSDSTAGRVIDVGPKPGSLVLLGTDNAAAIFFRVKGESQIFLWNTETCFKYENFLLVQKGDDCRLATHVVPGYKRLMWTLESNFLDFIHGTAGCVGASVALHPIVKTCD